MSDDWTDDVVVDGVVGEFHAPGTGAMIESLESQLAAAERMEKERLLFISLWCSEHYEEISEDNPSEEPCPGCEIDRLHSRLAVAEERVKELEGTIRHHRTIVNVPIDQREGADERQADMALWSLVEEER